MEMSETPSQFSFSVSDSQLQITEYDDHSYSKTTVGVSRSRFRQVDFSSRKIHPQTRSRRL
jgi:hypothetical protein